MPEVLIDVTRLLDRKMQGRLPTGVDRVSLEYVRHFSRRSTALVRHAGQWVELSHRDSQRIFEGLLSPDSLCKASVWVAVTKAFPTSFYAQFSAPRFLFNTGHSGLEKLDYTNRLQNSGLKPLFFVHDLIPITHPEYCRSGEAGKHRVRMSMMLKTGHGVIANSAATLKALSAYAQDNGLPMPQSVVALLAPTRLPLPLPEAPLGQPYFVMLGTIEPRKNHWLMLQLWRQLIEHMGSNAPRLVIIGQQGWECENVLDLLERCEILKGFVIQQQACSDTELASWLHHSQALLFPSFAEGYGLPLVEALAQGIPVIASDLPVFRETAGDIPEYVDPLDGMRWKALISDYAQVDSQARIRQCQRLKKFIAPTWDTHFERVEALMESLSVPAR
ncbi:MAG: glycosyltransferase family 1 protein [Methylococcales bacterium]|nr:glycosyltransferase family 1 protein [Methylococcales bacterium]